MINLELNTAYKSKEFFIGVIGEEPAKSTNSRKRQIRLIREKCEFYTIGKGRGMKYIITEIYTHKRIKLNGKYTEYMKIVLMYLLQKEGGMILAPKNVLMNKCGFVNYKYLNASENKKKIAEELGVLLSNVVIFYQTANKILGQAIKRTIGYLEDADYITVKHKKKCKFIITKISLDRYGNIAYENGFQKRTQFNGYMIMNEEQEIDLNNAMEYALYEYNFKKQSDVYKDTKGKKDLFYNRVNELISNSLVNYYTNNILHTENFHLNSTNNIIYEVEFDYYYEVYDIRPNKFIEKFIISEVEYKTALKNINKLSLNTIDKSIKNINMKSKKITDIFVLNNLFNEENSINRLSEDINILFKNLIKLNI